MKRVLCDFLAHPYLFYVECLDLFCVCVSVCVCMCTCTYMFKCLQVVMVHRNSIFNFLGQHGLLGALRHGRARASSEAGSPAHLPNPAASSWSSSACLYQQQGES